MKKRFSDLNVQSIFFLSSLGLLTAVFFVILLFPHVSQEFLVIGKGLNSTMVRGNKDNT